MRKILILLFFSFIFFQNSYAFVDIGECIWANAAINRWSEGGYISGYPDGTFKGNSYITRAEVASVLNKLNNSKGNGFKNLSKDVKIEDWFFEEMNSAYEAGFIELDCDGNLRPNDCATREEVMVMLAKLLDLSYSGSLDKASINSFKDVDSISPGNYYRIAEIVQEEFVKGYEDGTLRPKEKITRAEFICLLNNAIYGIFSSGEYNNKVFDGNIVINGSNVKITNTNIRGKIFVLDGAKDNLPVLVNTRASKGINSRVGKILIKDFNEQETVSNYIFEESGDAEEVIVTLKYSDTSWTNRDVTVKIITNKDDVNIKNKNIVFEENAEKVAEYEYKGKKMHIKVKVTNIDKVVPVVTAYAKSDALGTTVSVIIIDDGLSPIKEIQCSNGTINKRDAETGELISNFTIYQSGEYTFTVVDEAGNEGKTTITVN